METFTLRPKVFTYYMETFTYLHFQDAEPDCQAICNPGGPGRKFSPA
jgi:hypothetical protein